MTDRDERRYGWKVVWVARIGTLFIRTLGWTWRMRTARPELLLDARRRGESVIFSAWHGQLLPLLYHHRDQGISVLISEHADGEIIARVATNLGFRLVRGSSSRGAARALIGLARELEAGHDLAITPDGPRGPARTVAPGILIASQRGNAPILAVGLDVDRAWHLRTWDHFVIPKPFARVTVGYGGLLRVTTASARDATAEGERLAEMMQAAEEEARRA